MDYQERIKNFIIAENSDCPNYVRAIEWAKRNGYSLDKDISYNGYIYLTKDIRLSEDNHDVFRFEIQVYDNVKIKKPSLFHLFEQEVDFSHQSIMQSLMSETKWKFVSVLRVGGFGYKEPTFESAFELALETENIIKESYAKTGTWNA